MSYLEELLPEFRKGAKIRQNKWENDQYIFMHTNGNIYLATGRLFKLNPDHLLSDDWELYQEPIDLDYIIKNKCLCWFWDDDEFSLIGTLIKIGAPETLYKDYKYKSYNGRYWKHCRPVRRNEVSFYEERKDEF